MRALRNTLLTHSHVHITCPKWRQILGKLLAFVLRVVLIWPSLSLTFGDVCCQNQALKCNITAYALTLGTTVASVQTLVLRVSFACGLFELFLDIHRTSAFGGLPFMTTFYELRLWSGRTETAHCNNGCSLSEYCTVRQILPWFYVCRAILHQSAFYIVYKALDVNNTPPKIILLLIKILCHLFQCYWLIVGKCYANLTTLNQRMVQFPVPFNSYGEFYVFLVCFF